MPRSAPETLLNTSGARRRYRLSIHSLFRIGRPDILFQLSVPILAYIVFGVTFHLLMSFILGPDGDGIVPWLKVGVSGLNLLGAMVLVNTLFFLNIVIDAVIRWRQNRSNSLWQGVVLLLTFCVFVIFSTALNETDKKASVHLTTCESIDNFAVHAKRPMWDDTVAQDEWYEDVRMLSGGYYPPAVDIRIGLNAISIDNRRRDIHLSNGLFSNELFKGGIVSVVEKELSQLVQKMGATRSPEMKKHFKPSLNFSADSRLPRKLSRFQGAVR